ncbi:MAG: hypothetical protein U0599_24555 [Vicinamibacteria bacterium]
MKLASLALAVLSAASLALAADPAPVTGDWNVHASVVGNESDSKCTFTQKGADLTGTCTNLEGQKLDITGKVEGTKVTWSFKTEYNGTPLTVNHEGTLEGGKISGTINVPEFSVSGEFTATPAK